MVTNRLRRYAAMAALILCSAVFIMPFVWMLSTSFKHETRIFPPPGESPQWIPRMDVTDEQGRPLLWHKGKSAVDLGTDDKGVHRIIEQGAETSVPGTEIKRQERIRFYWENYTRAFQMMDFFQNLRNTLYVCFMATLGTVLSSSLVAYGFARIPWRGRDALFVVVLASMMLPYQVTLIPLFAVYSKLGWVGGFKPLVVPYFFGVPFYVFLLRQFFKGIPEDLSAAARIDGCTEFGIYTRIILPLAKPALATTVLFEFLFQWGDFLNPLIYLQDDRQYTLAIALQQFQSQHESAWGPLMAMSTVITVPVILLFFLAQRTFIQGITMSGLKG